MNEKSEDRGAFGHMYLAHAAAHFDADTAVQNSIHSVLADVMKNKMIERYLYKIAVHGRLDKTSAVEVFEVLHLAFHFQPVQPRGFVHIDRAQQHKSAAFADHDLAGVCEALIRHRDIVAIFDLFAIDYERKSVMPLVDLLAEIAPRERRTVGENVFHAQRFLDELDIFKRLVAAVEGEHHSIVPSLVARHALVDQVVLREFHTSSEPFRDLTAHLIFFDAQRLSHLSDLAVFLSKIEEAHKNSQPQFLIISSHTIPPLNFSARKRGSTVYGLYFSTEFIGSQL